MPILLIISSILCSALAQIVIKVGMNGFHHDMSISVSNIIPLFWKLITNVYLIGGITLYVLSLLLWIFVLKKVEVSTAYPFTSLGFVLVLIIGVFLLGESVNAYKVLGIGSIVLGTILVSTSM